MTKSGNVEEIWPAIGSNTTDGRRLRSDVARQKIVAAMFDLLGEGNMSPEATAVAQRAGVGLRTVFRHFEDMDSIYQEMIDRIRTGIMDRALAPLEAEAWRDKLDEYSTRRVEIYEAIFPMRLVMALRRYHSDVLMDRYNRDLALERSSLQAFLPDQILQDETHFIAIETAIAFPTWRRLRKDLGLSVEDAKAVTKRIVDSLVAGVQIDDA